MKKLIKRLLGKRIVGALRVLLRGNSCDSVNPCFEYDISRFNHYSAVADSATKGALCSRIIVRYHVLEKGLTMPGRRLGFGIRVATELMGLISEYERHFRTADFNVMHAIAVIRAYWMLHQSYASEIHGEERLAWEAVQSFSKAHENIQPAIQPHISREEFYKMVHAPFPDFALSRHTVRHFSPVPLEMEKIVQSVDLARTTPSACNRQHCRVHCIADKDIMNKLLTIQGGNRGFGASADKLLVVTASLECILSSGERNDAYLNGGIFLMNLCYALHYYEIAHCLLNWSKNPKEDLSARQIIGIDECETIIALVVCGNAPPEFDVAESPRKPLEDYLVIH